MTTKPLTPEEVAEIKERCEKATEKTTGWCKASGSRFMLPEAEEFYHAARSDIPTLCETVERLRFERELFRVAVKTRDRQLAEARGEIERLKGTNP